MKDAEPTSADKHMPTSLQDLQDLRAAFDEHSIVAITDASGKIIHVNDRFCVISKYTRAELLGQDHRIINSGHHPKAFFRDMWITIAGGQVWRGEIKNRAKDGSYYWVDTTIVPFPGDTGKPARYVSIRTDITQRKSDEQQMAQLAAIVASSDDAIIGKTLEGIITSWNRGAERIFGYSVREAMGRPIEMLIPPGRQKEEVAIREKIARNEPVTHFETYRVHKNGVQIAVSLSVSPIRDASGQVIGGSQIARDITQRKWAEEALGRSEGRYQSLFNSLIEGFCIIEVVFSPENRPIDYRFLEVNPAFERQTGLRDAQGKLMRDLAPNHEAHWFEIYGRIALTGEPERFVNEAGALNRWYDVSAFRIGGAESRKVAILFNDITEFRRAEMALRASERRERERAAELEVLLEAVPIPVFIAHDPACRHITGNRAASELLHIPRGGEASLTAVGEARPSHFRAVKDGRDLGNEELPAQRAAQGTPVRDFEFSLVFSDGTTRSMLGFGTPLRDEMDQPRGAVHALVDITERKQAEEKLSQLARTLAEKNKELEAIVYAASHDLRSPLVNIQGFSRELMLVCGQMQQAISTSTDGSVPVAVLRESFNDDIPRALHFIQASVARIDALISGFLRFSRVGRVVLDIQALDMNELMVDVVGALKFQLEEAGAKLQIAPLPDCFGDATHIGQVFSNLIDNAIKYRDPVRPLEITVSGRLEGGSVLYSVCDTGMGIAPEHRAKIFEIFHRLNPDAGRGDGLGLTIAQRILERHNGRISIDGQVGVGSTFFVSLPARDG